MFRDPIRVLVAADQMVLRRGLASLLLGYDDLVLVGEARSGIETLEYCAALQPDVVLLDLLFLDIGGVALTMEIRKRFPDVHVILMTTWDEHDVVMRALSEGAERYLLKNTNGEELASAIRQTYPTPVAVTGMPDGNAGLTKRELEVLQWMASGLTNPQIGSKLVVSRATVKFHVSSILRKLNVASRTEAVVMGIQNQLINGSGNLNGAGYQG